MRSAKEEVSNSCLKVEMTHSNTQPSSGNPLVPEEKVVVITEEDTTRMQSSWRHNVSLLGHIFFHAILIGTVVGAVVVSINRVYLYDHVVNNNATITYHSFFDTERIKGFTAIAVPIQLSLEIMLYGACQEGLTLYDSKYVIYLRACCSSFFVIMLVSVFVQTWFFLLDRISPVIVVVEVVCCFVILCLAAKHNGGDRDCIRRIVWTGFYAIIGSTYSA
eukprot:PhF_6_TR11249/c0_g1_i1/m.18146